LGRNGRDLNGRHGLAAHGEGCVRLPVGCHAPYNPASHLGRDVALEERGKMRAEMGDRVVLERRQPTEWTTGLQSKDPV